MSKSYKVVLTGAESTGKSTLSEKLAEQYSTIWIPEYSREYIAKLGRTYKYSDIEIIAMEQIKRTHESQKHQLVFFDTWLIITKVWFNFVYGKHPDWLHNAIAESNIDLFLVCDTDMPWVADPLRENGGENRNKLQQIYLEELSAYKFNYEIIKGSNDVRLKNAITAINKHIQLPDLPVIK